MKTLNIIVPCYNEEKNLENFHEALDDVIDDKLKKYKVTILFVNDGSKDKTLKMIYDLSAEDNRVKFVSLSRNFGKEAAILAGLRFSANADFVCLMDANLQHSPRMIPKMLKAVDSEDYDIAVAKKTFRNGKASEKNSTHSIYKLINKISEVQIDDGAQDFRVMNQKVVNAILCMPEYNRFSKGIFSWVGYKVKWFPYEDTNKDSTSPKKTKDLLRYAVDGIVSFSDVPLHLALWVGSGFTLFGLIYAIYLAAKASVYGAVLLNFAFIVALMFVIGGCILLSIGIMGEYVAKTLLEVKNRPNYVIDETNLVFSYKEVKELAEKPSIDRV